MVDIQPYLEKMELPGLIVSTGGERGFFDLVLAPECCEGLVILDINPLIIKYVHFNILLLRLAKNREHYVELSSKDADCTRKMTLLHRLLDESTDMPVNMKLYYKKHLEAFASSYYEVPSDSWRQDISKEARYYENDALFDKIQRYAKEGKILPLVQSIDDLSFLDQKNIAFLDVSNIPNYTLLNFQTRSNPKVIFTDLYPTTYHCLDYTRMLSSEEAGCKKLLSLFEKIHSPELATGILIRRISEVRTVPPFFCRELLHFLEELQKYILDFNGVLVDCHPDTIVHNLPLFNKLGPKALGIVFDKYPELLQVVEDDFALLIFRTDLLDPPIYFFFDQLPSWRSAIKNHIIKIVANRKRLNFRDNRDMEKFKAFLAENGHADLVQEAELLLATST